MKIDAHNHPDWLGYNYAKTLANMDDHRIAVTWLLSWIAPQDEYDPSYFAAIAPSSDGPIPFSRCLDYASRAPDRFVLGYAPDPRRPEALDQLRAAIDTYGVRVYGELKLRMRYDNPDALRMFRFCGQRGLPVVVHIDYEFPTGSAYPRPNWWYGGGIEAFGNAVAACPDTVFVGHAPGFWAHISGDHKYDQQAYPDGPVEPGGETIALLRRSPNLYADLSANSARNAIARDPDFGRDFLIEFQDRLLYARDGFGGELDGLLDRFALPGAVLRRLHADNALRLIPL
ncbi:MAG: amidohydrolase [Anaerolineae bacterium]|nr:amidohydrolase [Anaerolineae bacterium]